MIGLAIGELSKMWLLLVLFGTLFYLAIMCYLGSFYLCLGDRNLLTPYFCWQSLADSCFPINQGLAASRLHGKCILLECCDHSLTFISWCRSLSDFWCSWHCTSFLMWLVLQNFSCTNFVMLTLAIGALNLSLKVAGWANFYLEAVYLCFDAYIISGYYVCINEWSYIW